MNQVTVLNLQKLCAVEGGGGGTGVLKPELHHRPFLFFKLNCAYTADKSTAFLPLFTESTYPVVGANKPKLGYFHLLVLLTTKKSSKDSGKSSCGVKDLIEFGVWLFQVSFPANHKEKYSSDFCVVIMSS